MSQLTGFMFPMFQKGPRGRLIYAKDETVVLTEAAIRHVLLTIPGERLWLPEFGCRIHQLLFDPTDHISMETAVSLVYEALQQWVTWIAVSPQDITVSVAPGEASKLYIYVSYRIKSGVSLSETYSVVVAA
jgi:phage baseplate assembly protein W